MVTVRFARRIGWGHILAACAVDWDSFVYRPLLNSLWSATDSFRTLWHAIGLLLSLPGVAFVSFRDALERSFSCLANFGAPLRSLGDTQSIFVIHFPGEITNSYPDAADSYFCSSQKDSSPGHGDGKIVEFRHNSYTVSEHDYRFRVIRGKLLFKG